MFTVLAEPAPVTIEAWLTAWLAPDTEAMTATVSRPSAASVRQDGLRAAAARLLYRIADLLSVPHGPQPCFTPPGGRVRACSTWDPASEPWPEGRRHDREHDVNASAAAMPRTGGASLQTDQR